MVHISDIPKWLHSSELYNNLCKKSNEYSMDKLINIELPNQVLKPDDSINCIDDIRWMAYSIQYWILEDIPYSLYNYCITNFIRKNDIIILENENPQMKYLLWNRLKVFSIDSFYEDVEDIIDFDSQKLIYTCITKKACICGYIDILEFMYTTKSTSSSSSLNNSNFLENSYHLAAKYGHFDCLEYLNQKIPDIYSDTIVCRYAIIGNQLECLKKIVDKAIKKKQTIIERIIPRCWDITLIRHGNMEMLQYIYSLTNNFPYSFTMECCMNNQPEMFFYGCKRGANYNLLEVIIELVSKNYLTFLKRVMNDEQFSEEIVDLNIISNPYITVTAYRKGNEEMIEYIHSRGFAVIFKSVMYCANLEKNNFFQNILKYFVKESEENVIGRIYKEELTRMLNKNMVDNLKTLHSIGYSKVYDGFFKYYFDNDYFNKNSIVSYEMMVLLHQKFGMKINEDFTCLNNLIRNFNDETIIIIDYLCKNGYKLCAFDIEIAINMNCYDEIRKRIPSFSRESFSL